LGEAGPLIAPRPQRGAAPPEQSPPSGEPAE